MKTRADFRLLKSRARFGNIAGSDRLDHWISILFDMDQTANSLGDCNRLPHGSAATMPQRR